MKTEKKIAMIESTQLGTEDHGVLTCWLHVSYGDGRHQGIGGYGLDEFDKATKHRVGTAYGCEFIKRVLLACGVESWEKLPGRTIFAIQDPSEWAGFGHRVVGIAPLPTEPGVELLFDDLREQFTEDRP